MLVAVAGIATWASYEHAYAVIGQRGESHILARLYPGNHDCSIHPASMVQLDAAGWAKDWTGAAWWLLVGGVGR